MVPAVPFSVPVTGARFAVTYRVTSDAGAIDARARAIALEQTVEFPEDLLSEGELKNQVPGRVESVAAAGAEGGQNWFTVVISYADETAGSDFLQFLNVVFGNTSLQPGVKVVDVTFPAGLVRGPRFGVAGLRDLVGVPRRPLASTALKPMGLPAAELAHQAYQTALGGLDIVKDDHGLADQGFARFADRVALCAEAVGRANRQTGGRSLYAPNVTADGESTVARALAAQQAGAGAVLVSPGLAGFGALRALSFHPEFHLPIIAHPAFSGSFVSAGPGGLDHGLLYGTLMRAAGADVTIFPNFGGRFSFTVDQCLSIAQRAREPRPRVLPAFPSPGGGMGLDKLAEQKRVYGHDFVALVGGGLHREGRDLTEASRAFVAALAEGV